MKKGDTITFYRDKPDIKESNSFTCTVVEVRLYPTFEESLKRLSLDKILPGVKSITEGISIYQAFAKLATQQKFGVCMIEVSIRK